MPSVLDRINSAKAPTTTFDVVCDLDAKEAYDSFAAMPSLDHAEAQAEREAKLAELKQAMDESTVTLHFQAIGRAEYKAMIDACPPKGEVTEDSASYDVEAHIPLLITACCTDEGVTLEAMTETLDSWAPADVSDLYFRCIRLCNRSRVGDLGKGSSPTRG